MLNNIRIENVNNEVLAKIMDSYAKEFKSRVKYDRKLNKMVFSGKAKIKESIAYLTAETIPLKRGNYVRQ